VTEPREELREPQDRERPAANALDAAEPAELRELACAASEERHGGELASARSLPDLLAEELREADDDLQSSVLQDIAPRELRERRAEVKWGLEVLARLPGTAPDELRRVERDAVAFVEAELRRTRELLEILEFGQSPDRERDAALIDQDFTEDAAQDRANPGMADYYREELPAIRARVRATEYAIAARRRSCIGGPCRRTGGGNGRRRPRHRRVARANAPPGSDSEGEDEPARGRHSSDDLTTRALA
jgi:hypothetical protein